MPMPPMLPGQGPTALPMVPGALPQTLPLPGQYRGPNPYNQAPGSLPPQNNVNPTAANQPLVREQPIDGAKPNETNLGKRPQTDSQDPNPIESKK